jgi:UDP-N-acetylglucosamine--N-acetylmuramyl-(pentapeptide) pyrophosphoryl-undecaprenol N-acetylglucosamine transferase
MLMIAGGGTGGHIYPAIAVAKEFLSRGEDRRVVFVGTRYGLEKEIVPKAGFELEFVNIRGLKGKSLLQTVGNLLRLPASMFGAWRLISRHDPDVILGVGGYASGPVLMVGALRGRPTVIQEQNAFPGLTNRLLSKVVDAIAVAFPKALEIFRRDGLVSGNPVRSEFFEQAGEKDSGPSRRLLVFGGSQGSRILNETMIGALPLLDDLAGKLEIVHQTGPHDHDRVAAAYRESSFHDSRVTPFIDDMAGEMARADFVLCRAGAITIGELAALGRAAILVPFALASDNHQEFNARAVEESGGGVVITEKELTPERLAQAIAAMSDDPERSLRMGNAITALAAPDASRKIVDLLEKTVEMN